MARKHHQARIIELLQQQPCISYDSISAALDIDYKTAINIIRRLEAQQRLVKVAGRGPKPNRYVLYDA